MGPILIGVAGGSCSGKTSFAKRLKVHLGDERVGILYQDSYYLDQSLKFDKDGGNVNFDHPKSIEWDLMYKHLIELKSGAETNIPYYDFSTHTRIKESTSFKPLPVIIIDGTLILHIKKIRNLFDKTLFLDASKACRLKRRFERDTRERGRTEEGVMDQFELQVEPMNKKYVEPSRSYAEFVINGEDLTEERVNFISSIIKKKL